MTSRDPDTFLMLPVSAGDGGAVGCLPLPNGQNGDFLRDFHYPVAPPEGVADEPGSAEPAEERGTSRAAAASATQARARQRDGSQAMAAQRSSIDAANAVLDKLGRARDVGSAYRGPADRALTMVAELEELDREGRLGTMSLVTFLTADKQLALVVHSQRLDCYEGMVRGYSELLRALEDVEVRRCFLNENSRDTLRRVREGAAAGLVHAGLEALKLINQLTMCNCNSALAPWLEEQLASGAISPADPGVQSFAEVQMYPHYAEMVRLGADAGICGVERVHRAWLGWGEQAASAVNRMLEQAQPLVDPIDSLGPAVSFPC